MSGADVLLDAERAAEAGAVFGQAATRPEWGGLVVASARFVEYEVRATVLLVPGLFRLGLTPLRDTLGVALRPLTDHPVEWQAGTETWDVLRHGSGGEPMTFHGAFALPGDPLVADVRVLIVADPEAGGAYLASRAAIGRAASASAVI